jgi:hypothetical protein
VGRTNQPKKLSVALCHKKFGEPCYTHFKMQHCYCISVRQTQTGWLYSLIQKAGGLRLSRMQVTSVTTRNSSHRPSWLKSQRFWFTLVKFPVQISTGAVDFSEVSVIFLSIAGLNRNRNLKYATICKIVSDYSPSSHSELQAEPLSASLNKV